MRLVTWNINSVRLRIDLLQRLAQEQSPDVICLQETKVVDDLFPADAIKDMGYPHIAFTGMKGYNGVAILSRLPLNNVTCLQWCNKADCRHISAQLPGGIELHNFYIPAGVVPCLVVTVRLSLLAPFRFWGFSAQWRRLMHRQL